MAFVPRAIQQIKIEMLHLHSACRSTRFDPGTRLTKFGVNTCLSTWGLCTSHDSGGHVTVGLIYSTGDISKPHGLKQ